MSEKQKRFQNELNYTKERKERHRHIHKLKKCKGMTKDKWF